MSAGNVLLLLDVINSSLKTIGRINEMMMKAQIENRDVTDEEVKAIVDENDAKAATFIGNIPE